MQLEHGGSAGYTSLPVIGGVIVSNPVAGRMMSPLGSYLTPGLSGLVLRYPRSRGLNQGWPNALA